MSNKPTNNFIMEYKEAEIAEEHGRQIGENAWKQLRTFAARRKGDAEKFLSDLRPLEDKYMDEMYSTVNEAKKEDGTWKYRKFVFKNSDGKRVNGGLPMAYMSAKSTLKVAMEQSVEFKGQGKSAVNKACAEAKRVTPSAFSKTTQHLEAVEQLWPTLNADERDALRTRFATLMH